MPLVRLTDKFGRMDERYIDLVVVAPPIIQVNPIPAGNGGDTINYQFLTVPVIGQDPTKLVWSGTGIPGTMVLNPDGSLVGTLPAGGSYSLAITVVDANGLSDTKPFVLNVSEVLAIIPFTLPEGKTSETYTTDTLGAVGGTPPYRWEAVDLPNDLGLTFNTSNGQITGVPTRLYDGTLTVRVYDSSDPEDFIDYGTTLQIAEGLHIVDDNIPDGVVGKVYSFTLTGAEGTAPYTWTIADPPGGLTNNNAHIFGTPSEEETGQITVYLRDDTGNVATKKLGYHIFPEFRFETESIPNAVAGHHYQTQLLATGGVPFQTDGDYRWAVHSGPSWLNIDNETGLLSGTATEELVPYSIHVTVADNYGGSITKMFTFVINKPIHFTSIANVTVVKNKPFSAVICDIKGGSKPYTVNISGNLPEGTTFDPTTLTLSGTPTGEGDFPITIQATDSLGDNTSVDIVIHIEPYILSDSELEDVNLMEIY